MRHARNHAVRERVIRSAAIRFIPSGGELLTVTQGKRQTGHHSNDIFGVKSAKQRAPAHRRRSWIVEKTAGCAGEKLREAGERRLSVLAESNDFVRLKALEPRAKTQLMAATRQR